MLKLNSINCGDCLEVMKEIDDKSIDMILCDLPYGITDCGWDSIISLEKLWIQYKRISKENTPIVLFGVQPFTTKLINSNYDMFKYEWIWDKVIGANIGSANKMPLKTHENILIFYRKPPIYNPQFHSEYTEMIGKFTETNSNSVSLNSKEKKLSGKRGFPRTIIKYMRPNNMTGGGLHPTQKPVALFEYLIKTYTNEGALVLDNCAGSGTTGEACKHLNRNYILIEKEEKYCEIARQRIDSFLF